ncbi:iron dicitrate transporter FecR [Sphingobacterium faecium NBRC 15299]|uniref:FecR family protein n=1 Tax=Sphingobacterium faecium TaxID=34087 RepID=UPI000D364DEB|nr:FecR family protein [Sphingobacterium faecium]PTX09453.1 FecR family protein [Sphingobacterium faecium]GEM63921.1 iron dicitrate transporter FecR [Sphingobacterium faecium NBRC 15299]
MEDNIKQLFYKYINGETNVEELKELYDYFGIHENEEWLSRLIQDHLKSETENSDDNQIKQIVDERWNNIHALTGSNKKVKKIWKYWTAVAALLIGVGLVSMYYVITKQEINSKALTSIYGSDVLPPSSSQATLVLSDGRTIQLDSTTNGIQIGGSAIAYENGGLISKTDQVAYATLHVPNGGLYNVMLPDGSKVILNSGSSLSYPIRFDDSIRLVKLIGEGYFEVAKDLKHPFKVETTDRQLVTVLGTHFNVKSYGGELTETTLLEGKVALTSDQTNATVILKPGQQSKFNKNKFETRNVNAEEATAWSKNLFVFNQMTLGEIFKNLERWYDVEFTYPPHLSKEEFMMEIPKDRKLSEILEAISAFVKVTFKIEGRRITVKQE